MTDPKGFDAVGESLGYRTGTRLWYCSLPPLRATSSTTSTHGARTCSLSVQDAINKRKDKEQSAKERRLTSGYLRKTKLGYGCTPVAVVEVGADEAKRQLEGVQAAGSAKSAPVYLGVLS